MDLLECVLGLAPNLFYNSPMEACVVICRTQKVGARRGKVLFIDAVREVARERSLSFLTSEHQGRIVKAYRAFTDEPGFAAVATTEEILSKEANLSIPRYVRPTTQLAGSQTGGDLRRAWSAFDASGRDFWLQIDALVDTLDCAVGEGSLDA
jgi:type I restriction enzyme M protein